MVILWKLFLKNIQLILYPKAVILTNSDRWHSEVSNNLLVLDWIGLLLKRPGNGPGPGGAWLSRLWVHKYIELVQLWRNLCVIQNQVVWKLPGSVLRPSPHQIRMPVSDSPGRWLWKVLQTGLRKITTNAALRLQALISFDKYMMRVELEALTKENIHLILNTHTFLY